MVPPTFSFW